MTKFILTLVLVSATLLSSDSASALSPALTVAAPSDPFTIGPFDAIGTDPSLKEAMAEAEDALDDDLDIIRGGLQPGFDIVQVYTLGAWNGIDYTITYSVVIDEVP